MLGRRETGQGDITTSDASVRPLLVLVAGAPATGKTTLADRLATALRLPVLHRDHISHPIADAFDPGDPLVRRILMPASFGVFYALMDDLLALGGVVAETNFHRGVAETDLRPRCMQARTVLIHCVVAYDLSVARYRARFARGERHWSAFDAERLAQIDAGQVPPAWANAELLDLPVPSLAVNTTDGYQPDFEDILAFIHSEAK